MNHKNKVPDGVQYKEIRMKSAAPIWGAAAVWILAAVIMPIHKPAVIILTALVSLGMYGFITLILPKKSIMKKIPFVSGNSELDGIINSIDASGEAIAASARTVYAIKPESSDQMNEILSYILKIREDILKYPKKVKKISRFLNYYLPTTVKISDRYVYLLSQRSKGENVTEGLRSIETAFGQIKTAFIRQHDALFEEDALDLSTDVAVLETLLKQDSLEEKYDISKHTEE